MAEPNKIYSIRYRIETKLFTEDGKNNIDPIRIESMNWSTDYAKSFTPRLTIALQLLPSQIRVIKHNENRILLQMILTKVKYINSTENATNRIPVEYEIIFDKVFVPIIEAEDLIYLREYPESKDELPIEEQEVGANDRSLNIFNVRMYLNTIDYHIMYKQTFNTILRGDNNGKIGVDTALRFICETTHNEGYIVDIPDNKIPFENIIIPPGNVKYSIDSLQVLYGVYLHDILSFYDIDSKLYVLSRLNNIHDYEKGKTCKTILQVSPINDLEGITPGNVIYDTEDTIIHTMVKDLDDLSIGIAEGEANGDVIVFTNYGFSSETFVYKDNKLEEINPATREYIRNAISHSKTSKGVSFEYDELNNSYNMFSKLNDLGISSIFIAKTEGVDINCLKPNVIYNINIVGDENDNSRFVNKEFNLLGFTQDFVRDNDSGENDIFKTFEVLQLAYTKKWE